MLQRLLDIAKTPERKAGLQAELAVPPIPSCLSYLWAIYARLASRRSSNGLITYLEIDAFQRVTGSRLNGWEIEMIETLDRCFMAERYREQS